MFIRGTDTHVPLTFVRIQPYVSPKIELSDARQERVDLRVLPLIFRFDKHKGAQCLSGTTGGCLCQRKLDSRPSRPDLASQGPAVIFAGIAVLALLCGCAVGPNFQRPEAPPVDEVFKRRADYRDGRGQRQRAAI